MNFINYLKGKRTYYCALVGILYAGGALLGFYELDEKILAVLGCGGLAFLRMAMPRTGQTSTTKNAQNAEEPKGWEAWEAKRKKGLPLPLICLAGMVLVFSGCALQRTYSINWETKTRESYTGVIWLNQAALKGLQAHKKTKTGSTALSIDEAAAETQTEAIKALGAAFGAAAGEAAKQAVKP